MHVHVDAIGWQLDEQMHLGTPFLDRRDAVGLLDRVRDRAVANDPAVDEDVLRASHRPLLAKRGDEPDDGDASGDLLDADQVGPIAVDLVEALSIRGWRRSNNRSPLAG
jgi:hypothetical protein